MNALVPFIYKTENQHTYLDGSKTVVNFEELRVLGRSLPRQFLQ